MRLTAILDGLKQIGHAKLMTPEDSRALETLRQMMTGEWVCADCGERHSGLFDVGFAAPDHWGQAEAIEPNSALRLDGDVLTEDFCVIGGEHFFVRGVAMVPIIGLDYEFGFGVWSTLSRHNFELYVDGFDTGDVSAFDGKAFGWFSNTLKTFDETRNRKASVLMQEGRQRPLIEMQIEEGDPVVDFADFQKRGLPPSRLIAVLNAYGHAPQS